jgi:hypothetical protein
MEEGIEEYVAKMSTEEVLKPLTEEPQAFAELFDVTIEVLNEKMQGKKLFTLPIHVEKTKLILQYFVEFCNKM